MALNNKHVTARKLLDWGQESLAESKKQKKGPEAP